MAIESITLKRACLVGKSWHSGGAVLAVPDDLPEDRAKHLVKVGSAVVGTEPAPRRQPAKQQEPTGKQQEPTGKKQEPTGKPPEPGTATSLESIGLGGKTLEHLQAAGLGTVELIQAYLAAGKSLEDVKGIGEKTAASITAQIETL